MRTPHSTEYVAEHLDEILDELARGGEPVVFGCDGAPEAVLISYPAYLAMLEALGEASLLVEIDQALRNRLQQMRAEAGIALDAAS